MTKTSPSNARARVPHSSTYIHTYIHTYVHTSIHTSRSNRFTRCVHTRYHTSVNIHTHTQSNPPSHTHTHTHTHIHTHIHTYTVHHTQTHRVETQTHALHADTRNPPGPIPLYPTPRYMPDTQTRALLGPNTLTPKPNTQTQTHA